MSDAGLSLHVDVDQHRGRAIVNVSTTNGTGMLSVRWTPPRVLTDAEAEAVCDAATAALVDLLGT